MNYTNFQRTISLLEILNIKSLKYVINRVISAVFLGTSNWTPYLIILNYYLSIKLYNLIKNCQVCPYHQ